MRTLSRRQAIQYLRQHQVPPNILRALGDYSAGDPNTHDPSVYSERDVFYAPGGDQGGVQIVKPPLMINRNSFASYTFVIGASGTAQQILPANDRRTLLFVQNLSSSANLWVNFSADAGVNIGLLLAAGSAVFFDTVCPNNAISVFFAGGANQPGVAIEGAPQT